MMIKTTLPLILLTTGIRLGNVIVSDSDDLPDYQEALKVDTVSSYVATGDWPVTLNSGSQDILFKIWHWGPGECFAQEYIQRASTSSKIENHVNSFASLQWLYHTRTW